MTTSPAKLGRPVDSDGDATRTRVLQLARTAFAQLGYAATTYRLLAERAQLAPSALYNYFSSKAELYEAVFQETQTESYTEWLLPAIAKHDTFVGQIDALLQAFVDMNKRAPEVALFLAAARVDTGRHPELAQLHSGLPADRAGLYAQIVDLGITTGEIPKANRTMVLAMLETLSLGLVEVSANPKTHALAVKGFRNALASAITSQKG